MHKLQSCYVRKLENVYQLCSNVVQDVSFVNIRFTTFIVFPDGARQANTVKMFPPNYVIVQFKI